MTRKEVSQLYYLTKELAMWQEKYKELENSIRVSAPATDSDGIRASGTNSDKVGNLAVDIADTKKIIEGKIAEIQIRKCEILKWINTLEDSYTRQIVQYRCVDLMTWERVAIKVGGGNTADSVRMAFNRLFKE